MNIDVNYPKLEALIKQCMASGRYQSIEDALIQALESAPPLRALHQDPSQRTCADQVAVMEAMPHQEVELERAPPPQGLGKSLVDVCAMVRGLTTDVDFSRDPSTDRPLDLS